MLASTANKNSFEVRKPSACEVRMTRLFNAPRALVYEVMTQPEHVKRWWGQLGEGYSVPICEIDLRVGGKWRFVNRHPKGDAEFYGVYREIHAPGRIVFTEIYAPFPDAESVVTAILTDEKGKTRLNATSKYPSKQVRDMVLSTGMEKGAATSYDRLDEVAMELLGK